MKASEAARLEIDAATGDAEALFLLGLARLRGDLMDATVEDGFKALQAAAARGHADAQAFYGFFAITMQDTLREGAIPGPEAAWRRLAGAVERGSPMGHVLRGLIREKIA